ncbi:MAG: TIGR03619 family F420-dependent LLM class oxidoreductase [Acidimicrobiales bacterium]
MRFAITHPMISHPYHPDLATGAGVVRLAQAAEASGFDGYGFTDHPIPTQAWLDSGGHDALDPFVALGFVAAATSTLRLIPNIVVLPYRNPFTVAKAGATIDALSGGRFVLATGAGYLKEEYDAVGVDHAQRNAIFDEAIDAVRAVWTGDDVTFSGSFFAAAGVTAHLRPAVPPILGGRQLRRRPAAGGRTGATGGTRSRRRGAWPRWWGRRRCGRWTTSR